MPRTFAYVRVSTTGQTAENQVHEIEAAGFAINQRRIVSETISGSSAADLRPGFQKLVDRMEDGDVLVVTKLDRLGRNAIDVRQTVEKLAAAGIRVHCLALGGVDLTSSAGKMMMQVINAMAEFERDLLVERTQAGLARAMQAGAVLGRPSALSQNEQYAVCAAIEAGVSTSELARRYDVSRQTIMRLMSRVGNPEDRLLRARGSEMDRRRKDATM